MLRQAAERTGEAVGEGTSTATILAHAIYADGERNVVAGASAIDLKRDLDRGLGWMRYGDDMRREEIALRAAWAAVKKLYVKAGDQWILR